MAEEFSAEATRDLLRQVSYPGYELDIVSLGIVEEIAPRAEGGVIVTLRQANDSEDLIRRIASDIHRVLTHESGIAVEFRLHRIEPELGEKTGRSRLEGTRYVIAVASGKGGVGKSTVAANLAIALSQEGFRVGLLDADIYGPSVPLMFNATSERPKSAGGNAFFPVEKYGVRLISVGFFLTDKAPVIWRGPMVISAVRQFLKDTAWGTQDFLVVDLPPGTGDAQLTLAQLVPIDGVVIVTTPQAVATLDASRAIAMFRQVHCPILGIVENMNAFICADCGEIEEIFGVGGGARLAKAEGIPLLAEIPIHPEVREAGDSGMPIMLAQPDHPASIAFRELARRVASSMPD
jgi:ATP-binding protein involved in chromosome partitioning